MNENLINREVFLKLKQMIQEDCFTKKHPINKAIISGSKPNNFGISLLIFFCCFFLQTFDSAAAGGPKPLVIGGGAAISPTNTGVNGLACVNCSITPDTLNVIDADLTNSTRMQVTAGVGAELGLAFFTGSVIPGGTYAGFAIEDADLLVDILGENLLNRITIRTYLGGVLQETIIASDPNVGKEIAINSSINYVGFTTSSDFDEIQLALGGDLANTLTALNVYSVFTGQRLVDAIQISDYGASIEPSRTGLNSLICLNCSLTTPENLIDDADTTNVGNITITAGAAVTGSISVASTTTFPAGTLAGFAVSDGSGPLLGLLNADLLNSISINTYLGGVLQQNVLALDPIAGVTVLPGSAVNLLTIATTAPFDEIQIVVDPFLGVAVDFNVHYAFAAALCPPEIVNNNGDPTNSVTVAENSTGTVIDIDAVDDMDSEGNGLVYTLSGADANLFSIDANGVITFNNPPDFDVPLDSNSDNVYEVTVTVTDSDGLTDTQVISISVTNENDNPPVVADTDTTIDENSADGTVVITVTATDADGDTPQDFTIVSGNTDVDADGNSPFSIDPVTGVITVNDSGDLDFETTPCFDLGVTASDGTNTSAVETITVCLNDVVENTGPPVIIDQSPTIPENSPTGTVVTTIMATDPDGDTPQDFMIIGGNLDVDGDGNLPFSIDPVTGVITVNDPDDLDFENTPCFDLQITASDGMLTSAPETITVCLTNENDNPPVVADTDTTIDENSADGTVVITVTATDADGDTPQDFTIVSGNTDVDADGNSPFSIDPVTGVITVNDSGDLDFETTPCFDLGVTASDGTNTSAVETITVCLNDVVENTGPPVIIDQSPTIPENSPTGTVVTTIMATDPDGDTPQDFMIIGGNLDVDGDGNLPFSIDPVTGVITVNDPDDLDFENTPCFDLQITASDGMLTSAPETITVCLTNENDNAPVVNDGFVNINENTPNGTFVITVTGSDADGDVLQDFTIVAGNVDVDGDGNLPFIIDPVTGVVTVNDVDDLDFESMQCFDLGVTATDGTFTSNSALVTVCLNDINDDNNPPVIIDASPVIDENSPMGTVVFDLEASDLDGDMLSNWMIIGGNTDVDGDGMVPFTIDPVTGVITVNDPGDLDFETMPCFNLIVTVSDGTDTSNPETITVCLNNLNDNAPVINDIDATIDENSPDGTTVVTVTATDADGDTPQDWMIIAGNTDTDGDGTLPFSIDPVTGVITVTDSGDLDFETMPCFDLDITVSDGTNTSAVETITVCLNDLNDDNNPPVIVDVSPMIPVDAPTGTEVVDLEANDPDGDPTGDWMITDGNTDLDGDGIPPFTIDEDTGVITITDPDDIDPEVMPCFDLVVTVSDGMDTGMETITVCIEDDGTNNPPVIVDVSPMIPVDAPTGTEVVDLEANDPDGDPTGDWMITDGNTDLDGDGIPPFTIDEDTGVITITDPDDIDPEVMPCFDLVVTVSDGMDIATETITVCIEIIDNPVEVFVSPRLFLKGAYETGQMSMQDSLRAKGYLPTDNPYIALSGFDTLGTQSLSVAASIYNTTGADAIVDWVFLELRAADDNTVVAAARGALLQRDGDVVDLDGVSPVTFNVAEGDYYLVARHRNHLGVMTASTISLMENDTSSVDFTSPGTATFGNAAQCELEPGVLGLWAGNAKLDRQVIYQGNLNDLSDVFFEVLTAPDNTNNLISFIREGYNQNDLNMDGNTIYQGPNNDLEVPFFTVLSHPNNSLIVVTYIVVEQLP